MAFACIFIITLLVFHEWLVTLFVQSFDHDTNDYIPLVPLVSAFFFYIDRKRIFADTKYSVVPGVGAIGVGVGVYVLAMNRGESLGQNNLLSAVAFSAVIIWIGGFMGCYGVRAANRALFPLLFLLFVVPIPSLIMGKVVAVLQESSAEAAAKMFGLVGVPVLREGFVFHLTGMSIEVAEQCSGIHSALALFITSIVAGKLFLKPGWRRIALGIVVFPIAVTKNGLRIVTLTLLGNYVDARILSSALHRQGGIPFFVLAVTVLLLVLWLLRWSERFQRGLRPA